MPEAGPAFPSEETAEAAEAKQESKFPKLDGVLMPLVAANANVLVKASWMGGEASTLSDALKSPSAPRMTEQNADQIISIVQELLAKRVTEDDKAKKDDEPKSLFELDDKPTPGDKETEGKNSVDTAAEKPKKTEAEIKRAQTAKAKQENDKEKAAKDRQAEKDKAEELKKRQPSDERFWDIKNKNQRQKPTAEAYEEEESGPEEPEEQEVIEEELAELEPVAPTTVALEVDGEAAEEQGLELTGQLEDELEAEPEAVIEAAEIATEPEVLLIDEAEPADEIIEIIEEETPEPAIAITEHPVAEPETEAEALGSVQLESLEDENEKILKIQAVEEVMAEIAEAGEVNAATANVEIIEALDTVIEEVQIADEADDEGKESLEEAVTELLDAADIPHTPELVDALVYLAAHHQLAERLKLAITESDPDVIEEGIGTHEIIRSILAGISGTVQPAPAFHSIGSSAILTVVTLQDT